MKKPSVTASLVVGVALLGFLSGCVEEKPGFQLKGLPYPSGSIETASVPCETVNGDPVTEELPVACDGDDDCSGNAVCGDNDQCVDSESGEAVVQERPVSCSAGCPLGSECDEEDGICRQIQTETLSVPSGLTCEVPEAGSVSEYVNEVRIDMDQVENVGRFGEAGPGLPSNAAICDQYRSSGYSQRTASAFVRNQVSGRSYSAFFELINDLDPSGSVGLEGEGGGSGGFEGVALDANSIEIEKLSVSFPNAPGADLAREIDVAGVMESGGGGYVALATLFDLRDIQRLRELHSNLSGNTSQNVDLKSTRMTVRFTGKTIGGSKVESNTLEVPLRLCTEGDPCVTGPLCNFSSN